MKKKLCIILSILLCALLLLSCQKPQEDPPVIVGNEDPPITLGKENSFEIYVDGKRKPIEAYDLARVEDNGEGWGDPGDSEYRGANETPLSVLEKMSADKKGAILRIKVERVYQDNVCEKSWSSDEFYSYAEVTVEVVYANFSDVTLEAGDTFCIKQHYTVIQPKDEDPYLFCYYGSQPLRPGFSYICFTRGFYEDGQIFPLNAYMEDIGLFELSLTESRESFDLAKRDQQHGYLSPLATEVFRKYAPTMLGPDDENDDNEPNAEDYLYSEGIYQYGADGGKAWGELPDSDGNAVPDAQTAISIATEQLGKEQAVGRYQGFVLSSVFYDTEDGVWVVGFIEPPLVPGGSYNVAIRQATGEILAQGYWGE